MVVNDSFRTGFSAGHAGRARVARAVVGADARLRDCAPLFVRAVAKRFGILDGALYTSLHRMEERGWVEVGVGGYPIRASAQSFIR